MYGMWMETSMDILDEDTSMQLGVFEITRQGLLCFKKTMLTWHDPRVG